MQPLELNRSSEFTPSIMSQKGSNSPHNKQAATREQDCGAVFAGVSPNASRTSIGHANGTQNRSHIEDKRRSLSECVTMAASPPASTHDSMLASNEAPRCREDAKLQIEQWLEHVQDVIGSSVHTTTRAERKSLLGRANKLQGWMQVQRLYVCC
jgi:hypothetical protein